MSNAVHYRAADVSIIIPTYGRDEVLLNTIRACLDQAEPPGELIVVDQTPQHTPEADAELQRWHASGRIRWERRAVPSQPAAMNDGLRLATRPLVLFLDDDIELVPGFVAAHAAAHNNSQSVWGVVGQILQPGEEPRPLNGRARPKGFRADLEFPFWSSDGATVANVMSGNLSVRRDKAIAVGGFDENFMGVAYRFDTEFGRRLIAAGGECRFEPTASIRHLRAPRGGTRSTGSHLTSASPVHGMGDYYFALRSGISTETLRYMARRPVREVCTRFHLRRPWYIPVKLVGELRAFFAAVSAQWRGPKLIDAVPAPAPAPPAAAR